MKIETFKPPFPLPILDPLKPTLMAFLGGSIESGTAVEWQAELGRRVLKRSFDAMVSSAISYAPASRKTLLLLNPRRDAWDSSWAQTRENPDFYGQVTWELDAMDMADKIIFYFDPATKSPITLLELGLYAASGKVVVCCPPDFWRAGNVYIVCQRYQIPMVTDLDDLVSCLMEWTR